MQPSSDEPFLDAAADRSRRQPHAVRDLDSRRLKAMKIEHLLGLAPRERPIRLLEIGCGAGGISHYFGTHPQLRCEVEAVDVTDLREVTEGYRFTQVADTRLPFADASFDVVITNHVIEHVGLRPAQLSHLREVHRVLRPDGTGYLAVPNRWQLVEPHYKLAFLSWLPKPLRSPYLRLARKGRFYDCEPLMMGELENLLHATAFSFRNVCVPALRFMLEVERARSYVGALAARLPDSWLEPARPVIPTLIYILRPISEWTP